MMRIDRDTFLTSYQRRIALNSGWRDDKKTASH